MHRLLIRDRELRHGRLPYQRRRIAHPGDKHSRPVRNRFRDVRSLERAIAGLAAVPSSSWVPNFESVSRRLTYRTPG